MIVLDGSATIADVVALADGREQVSVSPAIIAEVGRAHEIAAELSTRLDIYGRTRETHSSAGLFGRCWR
jgi:histidine ammonia-lyase